MSRTVSRHAGKFNLLGAVVVIAAVVACAPIARKPVPPVTAAPIEIAPGRYEIDGERSALAIRVYRAGALSTLGHNHVLTSHALSGTLDVAPKIGQSHADIALGLSSLAIDTPQSRAAAGADFTSVPTADDIAATRRNLMGPKVLNASAFPQLSAEATLESLEGDYATLALTVHVAGHDSTFPVHAVLKATEREITIDSQFDVTHATLGLTPFSALGGALKVADTIAVSVSLQAVSL